MNTRSLDRRKHRAVPVPGRARRRAEARRVEILRAAARVFRERGYAAAGMREIAVAADLSPGNLYHYFRGKDEILFFCQDRSLDRLLEALRVARKQPKGPRVLDGSNWPTPKSSVANRLRQLAEAHVLCLIDEVEGSAAHLEVDALPTRLRSAIVAKRDLYERGVRSLVARAIREGSLRAADTTVMTRAFLGALNWTAHWFRPDGPQTPQHIAASVADYAVAGLTSSSIAPWGPTQPRTAEPYPRAPRPLERPS